MLYRLFVLVYLIICTGILYGQGSSAVKIIEFPSKYLETVSSKADKYYSSITTKTEKTLEKLSKWEGKIKTILEKTSPETAQRLFGNGQLTFAGLLQQYKEGKAAADGALSSFGGVGGGYNEYRDKVTTTVKYLDEKKNILDSNLLKPLQRAKGSTAKLNEQLKNTEAVQQFIKERKKQLMGQALQYLGKSKYLQKIAKENFYFVESLKNFRETFSDTHKTEEFAMNVLKKIPGFDAFIRKNSMLASLFGVPGEAAPGGGSLAGLQTRASVNNLIQQQIAAAGPNGMQQFQQNMQAAQSQLNELKNKILKAGGGSSDALTPDPSPRGGEGGFRPNTMRSKTFWQKWELGMNVQNQKSTGLLPVTSDLGFSAGYKPNDKSVIGVGGSFKMGWGQNIQHISISGQGLSLRSFADIKLKKSFWITGGFEMNYRSEIRNIEVLKDYSAWSRSGLVGVSKVVDMRSKFFKKTKLQLLWDFMSYRQVPVAQPIIFRVGYNLK
jgi:hypothetical protein